MKSTLSAGFGGATRRSAAGGGCQTRRPVALGESPQIEKSWG